VVKQFHYRGAARNFSNRYYFNNSAPTDATHWTTLSDAIVAAEKAIYFPYAAQGAQIVQTVGYAGGSEIPVFNKTYTPVTGTLTGTGFTPPGDVAAVIRWATADRSSKNHPVYLFNYFHSIWQSDAAGAQDNVTGVQLTAMGTYAAAWISGFSDGTTSHRRCRPNGDVSTGYLVLPQLTHRDLPR
jgi:hypothetical protein